jgi:hypothetical protein
MAHCEPKLKYPGKVFMHTSSLRTKDFFGVGLPPPRSVRRKITSVKVGQFQIFNFEFSKNFESFFEIPHVQNFVLSHFIFSKNVSPKAQLYQKL